MVDPAPVHLRRDLAAPQAIGSIEQQILNRIDAKLATFWQSIQDQEAAYLAAHGVYWQGILNPPQVPVGGGVAPGDNGEVTLDMSIKDEDTAETWADMGFSIPATLPMAIEIYEHSGPLGKAYTVILTVKLLGNTFRRAQGFGAESTWQFTGLAAWTRVAPDLIA